MSNVITVENLGKSYLLSHQVQQGSYTALRDVLADSVKSLGRRLTGRSTGGGSCREEFWALKEVSFEVKQGDRIGIIGRNGAGKSTLLKILSRITEPTTGSVRIKGRVASLLEVGTGFHPELTGRENIFLNGAVLGMSRSEIRKKFDEIVDFSEVERFLDTPVKRYSSGMYVRLAFAVAAHLEPEILVVDEVLAVGDAQFQRKCLGKMEEVGKSGRTVLFVSHQMGAISRLCHRVVALSEGRIFSDGEAAEVIPSYLNAARSDIKGVSKFPDVASKSYQIVSVSVHDAIGNELNRPLRVDESFSVRLSCRLSSPLRGGYATLEIKNHSGDYVLFSDSRDHPDSANFEEPGIISITVALPAPLLVPGIYKVSVYIARETSGTIESCEDAAIVEIEDLTGVRTRRPGLIYQRLQWQKEEVH